MKNRPAPLKDYLKNRNENLNITPGEFSRRPAMLGGGVFCFDPLLCLLAVRYREFLPELS